MHPCMSDVFRQFVLLTIITILQYHPQTDMKANNYEVVEAGEVITFQGLVKRSASQAYFLVFCTLLGMASLALVLQIQFVDLGKSFSVPSCTVLKCGVSAYTFSL
jgi:hypothetical protein